MTAAGLQDVPRLLERITAMTAAIDERRAVLRADAAQVREEIEDLEAERGMAVAQLRAVGLSTRAIAAALGVSVHALYRSAQKNGDLPE